MRYKFLFFFMISIVWMQSFANRLVGHEVYNLGSRSYAMGMSGIGLSESSGLLISNPAKLASFENNYNLNFSIENNSTLERRSFTTLDGFDGFLTYSDYVANSNSKSYINFGLTTMQSLGFLSLGLGLHRQTLYDLGYRYVEEVRGVIRLSDGTYGTGDPIVGQHIFETSGHIQSTSIGGALHAKLFNSLDVSFGLGLSQLRGSDLTDQLKVESFEESYSILHCTEIPSGDAQYDCLNTNTLSDANSYDFSYLVEPSQFFSLSSSLSFKSYEFIISYESAAEVYSSGYQNKTDYLPDGELSGLFQYTYYGAEPYIDGGNGFYDVGEEFTDYNGDGERTDASSLNHIIRGVDFHKPRVVRMGLIYSNLNPAITLSMELERRQHVRLNDINIYKVGFEYVTTRDLPIRFGLVYKPSYFNAIAPKSIFTFGTRLSYGNFNVDLSGSYSLMTYNYPDFFPVKTFNCFL